MAVDTPTRRPPERALAATQQEPGATLVRVAPELAVAKLGLRDIALLAAFEILTEAEQHAHVTHYRRAPAAGERVIDEHATAPDRPLPEIARLFFGPHLRVVRGTSGSVR